MLARTRLSLSRPWWSRLRVRWAVKRRSKRFRPVIERGMRSTWSRSAAISSAGGDTPMRRFLRFATWRAGTETTLDGYHHMRYQILIPHIPHRHAKLLELLDVLAGQMRPGV